VDADGTPSDPLRRKLNRLLIPVANVSERDFAEDEEKTADDGKVMADYTALRSELLTALSVLPDLLEEAEDTAGGGSRTTG
jgi:hypothetical protein